MIFLFNPGEDGLFFFTPILQLLPLPSFLVKEIWSSKWSENHFEGRCFDRFFSELRGWFA